MSINYSPELVQALMRSRILEGQEVRRTADRRREPRPAETLGLLDRLFLRNPEPVACQSC